MKVNGCGGILANFCCVFLKSVSATNSLPPLKLRYFVGSLQVPGVEGFVLGLWQWDFCAARVVLCALDLLTMAEDRPPSGHFWEGFISSNVILPDFVSLFPSYSYDLCLPSNASS